MLRQILEECQPGFAEVVLMLGNSATTAEVYTVFNDLRFTPDGKIVTFLAEGGTHLHLKMDLVREARFVFTMNQQGHPSYSLWLMDEEEPPPVAHVSQEVRQRRNQPAEARSLHGTAGKTRRDRTPGQLSRATWPRAARSLWTSRRRNLPRRGTLPGKAGTLPGVSLLGVPGGGPGKGAVGLQPAGQPRRPAAPS